MEIILRDKIKMIIKIKIKNYYKLSINFNKD